MVDDGVIERGGQGTFLHSLPVDGCWSTVGRGRRGLGGSSGPPQERCHGR
jgi:hypothetical protein